MKKLQDSGLWLYSPEPPESYTVHGSGPGDWVKGDFAKWNLIWLTWREPLEAYRLGQMEMPTLLEVMPANAFGVVAACARAEIEPIFPGLREALVSPINLFIHTFKSQEAYDLPAAGILGHGWVEHVRSSAMTVWNEKNRLDDQVPTLQGIERDAVSNVISLFGKKRS